jgi:hypothetical protein
MQRDGVNGEWAMVNGESLISLLVYWSIGGESN